MMEELRPSSGSTMGILTFGGGVENQQQFGFLGFLSHKERYTRALSTSECEIYRKRAVLEKQSWFSWQIAP